MRKLIIAGLLTAAIAVPVLAQPAAPLAPHAPMATKVMTRADVDARIRTHFARVDVNRDGFVTTEEMTVQRGARKAHRQARKGQGMGHGAMRDPNVAFDRLDTNRDGMIARDEFARGHQVRVEKRVVMNHGGAPGQPGAMHMNGHGKGGGMMGGAMLKMADMNRDGRVSLQEASAGAMRHFDMVDTNRDGRITPDERRAGRVHMKQMRTGHPG